MVPAHDCWSSFARETCGPRCLRQRKVFRFGPANLAGVVSLACVRLAHLQVKDCAAAARAGNEYQPKRPHPSPPPPTQTTAPSDDTDTDADADADADTEGDTDADADAQADVSGNDSEDLILTNTKKVSAPTETPEDSGAQTSGGVSSGNSKEGVARQRLITEEGGHIPGGGLRARRMLAGLSTWQALGLWMLVIGACLFLLPRLVTRLRRRPRSGMRTE